MTQRTTTVCDNCGAETTDAKADGWQKINLHPWEPGEIASQGEIAEQWKMGDICPSCADKIRQWLAGSLVAVFRKPKGKKG